jgi:hypothetical protein
MRDRYVGMSTASGAAKQRSAMLTRSLMRTGELIEALNNCFAEINDGEKCCSARRVAKRLGHSRRRVEY